MRAVVTFKALALCAAAWVLLLSTTTPTTKASFVIVDAFAVPQTAASGRGTTTTGRHQPTALAFGIPSFLTPKSDDDDDGNKKAKAAAPKQEEEKKVGLKGLLQLITAGAGAPFLGDFEGVDKETGNFMFSLEANNLVDENGQSKQTKMPYFENGWVDPEDEAKAAKRKAEGFKFPWQQ